MILDIIVTWFFFLIFLITFLIGYFLGQGKTIKETWDTVSKQARKALNTSRVGIIKRPTARDIYLKEHPKLKEEMEAMKEDLDKLKI